jgi:2-hydroxychromene-2-carboxylate isomerase
MSSAHPSLQFWFEFASTYSYLAAGRIAALASAAGVALEWRPFLLGPIFAAQGWNDSPFNIYPVKGRYMWRDMERSCTKYGIPFRRPTQFPRGSLIAARVACDGAAAPWCGAFVRAVYTANFAADADIGRAETIIAILDDLGQPGADLVAQAQTAVSKARLREHTDEAVRLGIFGAPTFVTRGEIFWGNDRLEDALVWAAGVGGKGNALETTKNTKGG